MADTVNTQVLRNGPNEYCAVFTNICDGTGESAVIKIDISTLVGPFAIAPTYVVVEEVVWSIQGFTSVRLFFDHTTDDEIAMLAGNGYLNLRNVGGLSDPKTTGGTGDILFTTAGNTAGSTYTVTIAVRLKS